MLQTSWRGLLAATALTFLAGTAVAQPRDKPLRLVVNVGLQNLDPSPARPS